MSCVEERSVRAPDDLCERGVRPMAAPLVLPHLLDEVLDVLLGGGARLLRPSCVAQRHLLRLALALAVGDGALLLGDRALRQRRLRANI